MSKLKASAAAILAALCAAGVQAGTVELPFQIGGAFSVPTTSIKEARFGTMIRQQYDFSCGSAALSTLLTHHYHLAVSEQAVFEDMFAHGEPEKIKKEGFSLLDMKRYLETHGFEADGFEAPLEKLASAGIPAIVLINDNGYNHFVVVKGLRDQRILLGDPSAGTHAMTRKAFEAIWVNQILFVISSHQNEARFNEPADWHVAVRAPLGDGVDHGDMSRLVMPKLGSSDF